MQANQQRPLPFVSPKEQARLERVERLLGNVPQVKRAVRLFDATGEREATRIAQEQKGPPARGGPGATQ